MRVRPEELFKRKLVRFFTNSESVRHESPGGGNTKLGPPGARASNTQTFPNQDSVIARNDLRGALEPLESLPLARTRPEATGATARGGSNHPESREISQQDFRDTPAASDGGHERPAPDGRSSPARPTGEQNRQSFANTRRQQRP